MNWEQLRAILWLRWRLTMNQWRRSGSLTVVISLVLTILGIATSVTMFFVSVILGYFLLPKASPDQILLMWDVIIAAYLLFWVIGLVNELQRSETLSLENLLHLPVSPSGTFLLNFLSSLLTVTNVMFVPGMLGLCLALLVVKGIASMLVLPLLASFVLMICALSYQFRGWLASLMVNKRRRRTIVTMITAGVILLSQIPNVLNMTVWRQARQRSRTENQQQQRDLQEKLSRQEIDSQQFKLEVKNLQKAQRAAEEARRAEAYRRTVRIASLSNKALPVGWLAWGSQEAARGIVWPALLGTAGGLALAGLSLRRSYRTTIRLYTGGFTSKKRKARPPRAATNESRRKLIEWTIPWCSEHAAAVATMNLQGLLRAPEAKMILLTPLILIAVFGGLLFGNRQTIPQATFPLIGLGAIAMVMFSMAQLLLNMFGLDRNGFRQYVLSPIPRREILVGKNLAYVPIAIGIGLLAVAAVQIAFPMRWSHLAATVVQLATIYVLSCLVANLVSTLAPMAISAGTMKPAKPKLASILMHVVSSLLMPVIMLPAAIPLGVDWLLRSWQPNSTIPVYLILAGIEFPLAICLYRALVSAQGRFLQSRERIILDIVTTPDE